MLHADLKEGIKTALKARDEVRLLVLRGLVAAATNELVATSRKPDEMLTDAQMLAVIKRAVNQRKDSIEQFEKGARSDLADKEKAELAILETFLPEMMNRDEIQAIAKRKKAELGVTDKKEMGKFMGAIMKEAAGRADGAEVKAVVESLFT